MERNPPAFQHIHSIQLSRSHKKLSQSLIRTQRLRHQCPVIVLTSSSTNSHILLLFIIN